MFQALRPEFLSIFIWKLEIFKLFAIISNCFGFALLCSVIRPKTLLFLLNQLDAEDDLLYMHFVVFGAFSDLLLEFYLLGCFMTVIHHLTLKSQ